MKKFARLAAFGALGVSVGVLALYLLVAIGGSRTPTSGVDATHASIVWISVAVPAACIIAAHIAYAVHLLRYSKANQG